MSDSVNVPGSLEPTPDDLINTSHIGNRFAEYVRKADYPVQQVRLDPEHMLLQVGELRIEMKKDTPNGLVSPNSISVLVDGKDVHASRFVITLDVHEVPKIEMTFHPVKKAE